MKTIDREALPDWARQIADAYLPGVSSLFLLHANVFDLVLYKGEGLPLRQFLCRALLGIKETVVFYNISEGFTFPDAVIVAGNYIGMGLTWCDAHLNSCRDTSHSKIEE